MDVHDLDTPRCRVPLFPNWKSTAELIADIIQRRKHALPWLFVPGIVCSLVLHLAKRNICKTITFFIISRGQEHLFI